MTQSTPLRRARHRALLLVTSGALVAIIAACGGGATPSGGAAATSGSGDGSGNGSGTGVGEPYDPAVIEGAADVLATVDSYVYEATTVATGGSGTKESTIHGIVRTSPTDARAVTYTSSGDSITLMYAEGKDYADYGDGNGFVAVSPDNGTREDTDPLAIRTLYGSFSGVSDDMIVAGTEVTHEIPTVHLVMDPDALAAWREDLGAGNEGWVAELWLAEADGQLVKAIWGGPLAPPPPAFSAPNYTIDVTDTQCDCPVDPPA